MPFPFALPATAPKRMPMPPVQKETTASFASGETRPFSLKRRPRLMVKDRFIDRFITLALDDYRIARE